MMSDRTFDYAEDLYDRSQEPLAAEWEDARKFGLGRGRWDDEQTVASMVDAILSHFEEQEGTPEVSMEWVRDHLVQMVEDDLGDEPEEDEPLSDGERDAHIDRIDRMRERE